MNNGTKKVHKDYRQIIDPFISSGELHIESGKRHTMLVRPDGHKFPIPGSPSDHRAMLNFKAQLRKFLVGQSLRV